MILSTWMISFAVMLPTWTGLWGRFGLDTAVGSCSILTDSRFRSPKIVLFCLAFLVPGLCILICYPRIYWLVRRAARRRQLQGDRAICTSQKSMESMETQQQSFGERFQMDYIEINRSLQTLPIEYSEKSSQSIKWSPLEEQCETTQLSIETNQRDRWVLNSYYLSYHLSLSLCSQEHPPPLRLSARDRHLLKMILIIFGTFVLCYLPITVSKVCLRRRKYYTFHILAYLFIYITTCVNPFIYVLMSSEYRRAFQRLFATPLCFKATKK